MKPYKRMLYTLLVLCLLVSVSSACRPAPTPTPIPTPTPLPTVPPSPTPPSPDDFVKQGDELLLRSDFAGAEAAYKKAIEIQDKHGPAYIGLSRGYRWQAGREKDALAQAQKAVELMPESALAYAALAQAQTNLDATSEAVTAGEKAVKLDSKSAIAQAALARAYLDDRQYEPAQLAATMAFTLDAGLAEAYYTLGTFYSVTADFSRARAALEKAIALEPNFAPWHVALGRYWSEMEDYDRATASFKKALELAPDDVRTILELAGVHMGLYEFKEAEARIQKAAELLPHEPSVYVDWGYLYLRQEKYDKAMTQFRQALTEDPKDWWAQYGVGLTFLRQNECDNAARQFQDLETTRPRVAMAPLGLAAAKFCSQDINKALEYLRKAQTLELYNWQVQEAMADGYSLQKRWEDAAAAYAQALRLSPARSEVHDRWGNGLLLQGDTASAKAEFQLALQLNAKSPDALLRLGGILLLEDKSADAESQLRQSLALQETNSETQQALGIALVTQGKAEQGAEFLKQVLKDKPENAYAHLFLGLAYRDMEKFSQAKKELETYVALNPNDKDQRIPSLIKALDQGYWVDEDKATSDLAKGLEQYFGRPSTVRVEKLEGNGRTFVVAVALAPIDDQQTLMNRVGTIAGASAYVIPRIKPIIENGLLIRLEQNKQPWLTVQANFTDTKKYTDASISGEQFISKLQFSRGVPGGGQASLKAIEADVSKTRALNAKSAVPYHPLTSEEMDQRLTTSMDAEARREVQTSQAMLVLLGLIQPDVNLEKLMNDLYVEQVAGFYNTKEKAFYVRDSKEQTVLDQLVIAHEYVHALQDQNFGLKKPGDCADADQCRAFTALVEGDATLAMYLYADKHIPVVDILQARSRAAGVETRVLDSSPTFIQGMQLFPYNSGLSFVASLYQSGGWTGIDKAYQDPPQSTEQILHPERYREKDKPLQVSLPDLAAALKGGWRQVESDVMGELEVRLTLAQHIGPKAAELAAKGWGGDRYVLLQQGQTGPYVLVMRTGWDDQSEADEFWSFYQVLMGHRTGYTEQVKDLVGPVPAHWWSSKDNWVYAHRQDRYVDIVIGPDQDSVAQVVEALSR